MSELILHHYAVSPFSEKVRLVLGLKRLAWRSVDVPIVMPKPDVVALTGGYRRTPLLQIGADVYCDTALICRVLDRLAPEPSLYPASAGGIAPMVAQWADAALYWAAVPYTTMQPEGMAHIFAGAVPADAVQQFRADRAAMTQGRPRPVLADCHAQVVTYFGWLEAQLADGRPFLCGNAPCIADFSIVQSVWFIRRVPPVAVVLEPYPALRAWADRVTAFGHGTPQPMSSADAIALAAASTAEVDGLPFDPGASFARLEHVTVAPTDYACDPVEGELVGLSDDSISVRRDSERAGRVVVHFPRIGFQIRRVDAAA